MAPDDQRQPSTALAEPRRGPPATVGELLRDEERTTRRLSAVATRHLSAERAAHLAISAVRKTPLLAKCTPASFMGALMGATALGLEPNTLKDHAYLIPYKRREPKRDQHRNILKDDAGNWLFEEWVECQLQVGYKGFITLLYRSPLVTSVDAEAIYDVDRFRHVKGTNTILEFEKSLTKQRLRPIPDQQDRFNFSPGLQGAFCYTALRDGQAFTVTPLEDLYRARGRSQAWNSSRAGLEKAETEVKEAQNDKARQSAERRLKRAQQNYAETPWVLYEDAMAAKTSIRRHAKQTDLDDQDQPPQISIAADLDALGDAGAINMEALADPERAQAVMRGEEQLSSASSGGQDEEGAAETVDESGTQQNPNSDANRQQAAETETAGAGNQPTQSGTPEKPTETKAGAPGSAGAGQKTELFC